MALGEEIPENIQMLLYDYYIQKRTTKLPSEIYCIQVSFDPRVRLLD
jgi:hypothetical protein